MIATAITLDKAYDILKDWQQSSKGRVFSVKVIKRTTGEIRDMQCRFDVKSYLKGGDSAYNPDDHGLMCVFDMQLLNYRSINLNGIMEMSLGGQYYIVQ